MISSAAPGKETEIEGAQGARGALIEGVPVHSIRSMGYVASQEVVFGSMGQRSLFVTIHGIALLICQVFYLESVQLKNATVWWLD